MSVDVMSGWRAEIDRRLPELPTWARRGLSEWSFGIAATQHCGTDTVAAFIAELTEERSNTVRQRLREFYQDRDKKRGPGRTDFDVTAAFAPLLSWAWSWREPGQTHLALALDATSLRDVLTVLSVSVLVSGSAIPVAWHVVDAQAKGAWQGAIEALFVHLRSAVASDVSVIVTADRGLYAPWLFEQLTALGWHPLLRINTQSTYRRLDAPERPHALADLVSEAGHPFAARASVFTHHPLRCTLVARRDERHAEPWVVVTDLAPDQVEAAWYGVRSWIEAGFKDLKRGGLRWHLSRAEVPSHAARQWLALSVALLYLIGRGQDPRREAPAPPESAAVPIHTHARRPRRVLSAVRQGVIRLLADLVRGVFAWPHRLDLDAHHAFTP